ncbi:MAG TPA: YbhB/YbcL family Raf kinase inhibitor-like protein [Chryseosolibacter sp.]
MAHPALTVSSTAFSHGGLIPPEHTCDGAGKNPPLDIEGIPGAAKSLVLIIDDPDAPNGTFDHWIVWNIPPQRSIQAGSAPGEVGRNSMGQNRYTGPCPPTGTHRYFFKVYALDTQLKLDKSADKAKVEHAMKNHILAYGELMGNYKRKK